MALRFLPSAASVRPEYQQCALLLNIFMYLSILTGLSIKGYNMFSQTLVTIEETESESNPPWGRMPWIVMCVDHDTGAQLLTAKAIVAEGFGYYGKKNTLSEACTIDAEDAEYTFVNGARLTEDGECFAINLTSLIPFTTKTELVNNIAFGAVMCGDTTRPNFSQPKYLAVQAMRENPILLANENRESFFNPQLFVNVQRFLNAEQRFISPVFAMEKQITFEPRPDWRYAFQLGQGNDTFKVSNMGAWDICLPRGSLTKQDVSNIINFKCNISTFGIFITKRTVTTISELTVWHKVLSCFSSLGGSLYVAYVAFFCIYAASRKDRKRDDSELLTLRSGFLPGNF